MMWYNEARIFYFKEAMRLSEQKFESILTELQKINEHLTKIETEKLRQGEYIQQLLQVARTTNLNLEKLEQDTIKHFDRADRPLCFIEADLDLIFRKSTKLERDINRLKLVE